MARKQEIIWRIETRKDYNANYKNAYVTQEGSWEYVVFPGRTQFEVAINSRKHNNAHLAYNLDEGVINASNPKKIVDNSGFILTALKGEKTTELAMLALNELEDILNAEIIPKQI